MLCKIYITDCQIIALLDLAAKNSCRRGIIIDIQACVKSKAFAAKIRKIFILKDNQYMKVICVFTNRPSVIANQPYEMPFGELKAQLQRSL